MTETKTKQKIVVVGMSGGVDSSLTAALLKEQGYFVIGVYMKNWSEPIAGVEHCPWVADQLDARRVAHQLHIPFYTVNFEAEYKAYVIESFLNDYEAGRTPNPDVLCNQFIKFDAFFRYARSLGADYIATGHYARIHKGKIAKGVDRKKDQSYFLWAIQPSVLSHTLFPLGGYKKSDVRMMAQSRGLITARKKDSQGICFIGQADVQAFLRRYLSSKPGVIVSSQGNIIGRHAGAAFYTIGQRVGIADITWEDMSNRPTLYVKEVNVRNNTVTVAPEDELYHTTLVADKAHWFGNPPPIGALITAKIRYGQAEVPCAIVSQDDHSFTLRFLEPQRAITPGQSVVCYVKDQLIGGGVIVSASHPTVKHYKENRAPSYTT